MTQITSFPWLPVELLERIIIEAWRMRLTAKERITFMSTSFLVNKTWMRAFAAVSSQDVHIPSLAYAKHFVDLVRRPSRVYKTHTLPLPNEHCETITYTLQSGVQPKIMRDIWVHDKRKEDLGWSVAMFLYDMQDGYYLKQFHHLIIDYVNWDSEDIFTNLRFTSWPEQITNLEVNILSTDREDANGKPLKGATADYTREEHPRWYLDPVRDLTVVGGSVAFVAEMVATCTQLETLTVDGNLRMTADEPLPENIHTLTLCEHPMAVRQSKYVDRVSRMLKGLPKAAHASKPRVVVERRKIEESAWAPLEQLAKGNDLTLTHND